MSIIIGNTDSREFWWAINNNNSIIGIGDLPKVPGIKPGKRVDLLRYYSKDKISDSNKLKDLMNANIVTLKKVIDGETNITSNPESVSSIEKEEFIASSSSSKGTTVTTSDNLQTEYNNLLTAYGTTSSSNRPYLVISRGNYGGQTLNYYENDWIIIEEDGIIEGVTYNQIAGSR